MNQQQRREDRESGSPTAPLVGTWRLVGFEVRERNGAVRHPLGTRPTGFIMYAPDGHMSVLMVAGERPRLPGTRTLQDAGEAELAAAARTALAYAGIYTFDPAGRVVHHAEASLYPNWAGSDLIRHWRFEGGRLILSGLPPDGGAPPRVGPIITWERAAAHPVT